MPLPTQRTLSLASAFLLLTILYNPARAVAGPQTIPGLGTTSFQTSTRSPEAQAAFMRGLLLLHLFEYADAAKSFVAAQKLDPAFAMAYWGEAMTFNHGVWNQLDAAAGKAALDKFAPTPAAREDRVPDPREMAYLSAVELLYTGADTKTDRDKRYSQAMERLAAAYPSDRNAQLFYALALLSQSESVRDVPVYLQAAAISKAIFRLEPQNPGAAHYWIHGMDDPDHAAGALEAARALSKIAPDAPHAQHMCSHIFMALGMWDDVVQANVEAIRVGALIDQADGFPPFNCGHYPEWLAYSYFQQGRFRAAQQTIDACKQTGVAAGEWIAAHPGKAPYGAKDPARVQKRMLNALADMQAMAVIEAQNWNAVAASDRSALVPEVAAWSNFAMGFAAAQRADLPAARAALQSMQSIPKIDPQNRQSVSVGIDTLSGLIQVKDGQDEAGLAAIRRAIATYRAMAFAFGPPETIKPPEELLGEILLHKGDAAGARQAFEQSLQRAPGRAQSLLGLARAEQLAGDKPSAQKTYRLLLTNWHDADPGKPGLEEARKALSVQ